MNRFRPIILAAVLVTAAIAPRTAQAAVRVFACEPEWAALATAVGGDRVAAFAATHARQDPHHIRARPSLIARIRKADLLICSGGGLEVGWLPILMQRGGAAIQPGQPGHLMAADYVAVLEKPAVVDRALGDIHPEGNPHVHLDPRNILTLGAEVTRRLARIDPGNAGAYAQGGEAFTKRWRAAMGRWEIRARQLKGMPVIVHHKSWSYLIAWLDLQQIATLEPKPGLPPTASHVEALLKTARTQPVRTILRTPYDPADASEWLSARTGIPALVLPYTVGGDEKAKDLESLFEHTLTLLEGVQNVR